MIRKAAAIASLALIASPAFAQCPASAQIDGTFKANDKGTYQVRSVGPTVWWIGRSADNGASWTNVFKGTRKGDIVSGAWADVGTGSGSGTLTLRVTANNQLRKLSGSGDGFGGSIWLKPGCTFSNATPID
jgi:hypothetical protein